MTTILEDYQTYTAPRWVRRTVERLVQSLAEEHLHGVSAIILTDSARIRVRKDGRRPRRNRSGVVVGRYHPRSQEPAWIELIVDDIVLSMPKPFHRLQAARDAAFGRVLFHEVGHHLHLTVGSAGRGGESSADAWESRLSRMHMRKRYGYLRPVFPVIRIVVRVLRVAARFQVTERSRRDG